MKPVFKHRPFGRCFWSAFRALLLTGIFRNNNLCRSIQFFSEEVAFLYLPDNSVFFHPVCLFDVHCIMDMRIKYCTIYYMKACFFHGGPYIFLRYNFRYRKGGTQSLICANAVFWSSIFNSFIRAIQYRIEQGSRVEETALSASCSRLESSDGFFARRPEASGLYGVSAIFWSLQNGIISRSSSRNSRL